MSLAKGDVIANKYRIESEVGRGNFGRVYVARDITLDRVVAIKELDKVASEMGSTTFTDHVRRFEREARIQARFNHPNIVHVYELIPVSAELLYLVMEYVDGGSLKQYLERKAPLPLDEVVRLTQEILAGLAVVHADPRDIVHRDIKPSNILLTKDKHAKLTDFGLAQVGDESMRSQSGQPHPGTVLYMSPEQETTSAYLYPTSDLFAVGCVMFEMLTGMGYKPARRRKQTLRDLRADVPAWLEEVVARALEKDAEKRVQSAEEMAELLRAGSARQEAEREARERAEREAKERAEREARERAEREAKERAEREAKERAEREAKERAEREARERAEREAKERAEREAKERTQREAEEKARRALAEDAARKTRAKTPPPSELSPAIAPPVVSASHVLPTQPAASAPETGNKRRKMWKVVSVIIVMAVLGVWVATVAHLNFLDLFAPAPAPIPVEMVFVPAGEFLMGSSDTDNDAYSDEKPPHTVYLDAFYIDQYEVTNAQYKKCVDAGKCSPPILTRSYTRQWYYGIPAFNNYPVIYVNWEQAKTYCEWRGARLPTEAEWEKAARGTDGRLYPWGNTFDKNLVNSWEGGKGDTTPVGSYPSGASPYGALDMAGNVWEWVADWYDGKYYANSPRTNPTGPTSGQNRVLRGGAWYGSGNYVRAALRFDFPPSYTSRNVGFRCARSP